MSLEDRTRLKHLLDAARKAAGLMADRTPDEFKEDELASLAAVRLLEICGEAAKAVSDQCREENPHLPWRSLARTRDRLIHGYFDVDLDVVVNILTKDLPPVIAALEKIMAAENA